MWLNGNTRRVNIQHYLPSRADHLFGAYAKGRRDFQGWSLVSVDLTNADLRGANLAGANLTKAKLVNAHTEQISMRLIWKAPI
jgi:uncharacterized protein YjbI with pentapeptide repeats